MLLLSQVLSGEKCSIGEGLLFFAKKWVCDLHLYFLSPWSRTYLSLLFMFAYKIYALLLSSVVLTTPEFIICSVTYINCMPEFFLISVIDIWCFVFFFSIGLRSPVYHVLSVFLIISYLYLVHLLSESVFLYTIYSWQVIYISIHLELLACNY